LSVSPQNHSQNYAQTNPVLFSDPGLNQHLDQELNRILDQVTGTTESVVEFAAESSFEMPVAYPNRISKDPVILDPNRIFYVREGDQPGGFKHGAWSSYWVEEKTLLPDGTQIGTGVKVVFENDLEVTLIGQDARSFLQIVQDRYAGGVKPRKPKLVA
jgi:hypothetical protein